jgi:cytochrome b subunit of formate dehydrogenase
MGAAHENLREASLPEQDKPHTAPLAEAVRPDPLAPDSQAAPTARDHVLRFAPRDRWLHLLLMASFLLLSLTGILLLFAEAPWAAKLASLVGGYRVTGKLHRLGAIMLGVCFALHVGRLLRRVFAGRELGLLWGRDSMVPGTRDLADMNRHLAWFVGLGPRPAFERYTYWEKFDYWAVFWGLTVVGLSGLMLWTPDTFTRFLPGWVYNIALLVHGEEALLIMVFIFTVHFFNGHLRPDKFPMDLVIFTGRVSLKELKHERPAEYERMVAENTVEEVLTAPPSRELVGFGRLVGTLAVLVGLSVAVMAIYALLH